MKLHLSLFVLVSIAFGALLVGCEQWRANQYPASETPEQAGMNNSQWQSSGGAPATQPSR